jgi:hypothetical protein
MPGSYTLNERQRELPESKCPVTNLEARCGRWGSLNQAAPYYAPIGGMRYDGDRATAPAALRRLAAWIRVGSADSDGLKDNERDDPTTRALRVCFIAIVIVVHTLPKQVALRLPDDARAHSNLIAPELDRDGLGVGEEVVIPGGVMSRTGFGGHNDEAVLVRGVEERGRPQFA